MRERKGCLQACTCATTAALHAGHMLCQPAAHEQRPAPTRCFGHMCCIGSWAPVPARANTGRWAGLSTTCGVARGARARARRARHGVRGVRGTASAGCGSACGGSRASGGRRWSTPSVRAPSPFGPTDATDPIAWSTCLSPPPRPPRASTPSAAGAPRLHKSCRERRPQSKGRSWVSGRARRDLRVRGGRGHLSERPGWPSGSPI